MHTLVLYLLDNTGSMQPIREVTVQQFNEMLAGLKDEDCFIRLVKFSTLNIELVTAGIPMRDFKLGQYDYDPMGGTPLHDAIGQSILLADAYLKSEADAGRTYQVLCIIHTDGQENSSRQWTLEKVKDLIAEKKATGFWQFMYAGVGQEAWVDARAQYGVDSQQHVTHDSAGAQAAVFTLTNATRSYARTGKLPNEGNPS